MLTSASSAVGHQKFADNYFYIKKQLLFGVLPGLFLFFLLVKIDYHLLKKLSLPFFIASVILLVLVFIPSLGTNLGTTSLSWIKIGGFSFQPSEIAKFALIIFMAAYLSSRGKELLDFKKGFLGILGIGLIPIALVVLEPDIGTASILFILLFGILFVGGVRWPYLIGLGVAAVAAFLLLIAVSPYRMQRFMTFMHPELDPQGIGYQINQSFLAIGSGGWWGRGLGHSLQKFQYLPEVHADSIFAIIAEEMGFVFVFGFVALLVFIVSRGLIVAKKAPDEFGRMLASGIIIWLVCQSFLNIGAMAGILPLTGIPLPFVSHGGTALMVAMGAVGVLINISKQTTDNR